MAMTICIGKLAVANDHPLKPKDMSQLEYELMFASYFKKFNGKGSYRCSDGRLLLYDPAGELWLEIRDSGIVEIGEPAA